MEAKDSPDVIILDDPAAGIHYTRRKVLREDIKVFLNRKAWQCFILSLVFLDACLVATDIVLSNIYCSDSHPPHAVERTEEALRYGSITILSFFILEWILEAWVYGIHRWLRAPLHLLDFFIITTSLTFEVVAITLEDSAVEIGSLIVVFRLWRVVRVLHAAGDATHVQHEEKQNQLRNELRRLRDVERAHHVVIQELHREYAQRLQAVTASKMDPEDGDTSDDEAAADALGDIMQALHRRGSETREAVLLHQESKRMLAVPLERRSKEKGAL